MYNNISQYIPYIPDRLPVPADLAENVRSKIIADDYSRRRSEEYSYKKNCIQYYMKLWNHCSDAMKEGIKLDENYIKIHSEKDLLGLWKIVQKLCLDAHVAKVLV